MYETYYGGVRIESSIPTNIMAEIMVNAPKAKGFMEWWDKELKRQNP